MIQPWSRIDHGRCSSDSCHLQSPLRPGDFVAVSTDFAENVSGSSRRLGPSDYWVLIRGTQNASMRARNNCLGPRGYEFNSYPPGTQLEPCCGVACRVSCVSPRVCASHPQWATAYFV